MVVNKTKRHPETRRTRWLCLLLAALNAPPLAAVTIGINTYQSTAVIAYGDKITEIGDGIILADDDYNGISSFRIDDVGETSGRHVRDNSLFSVTLTGYQHGHTIAIPIKLGRTTYNTRSLKRHFYSSPTVVNNGCVTVLPARSDTSESGQEQIIDIDPGNDIKKNCTGSTIDHGFDNIKPAQGIRRQVLFDLPTMMRSEAYQRLPPDLYFCRSSVSGLEHWQGRSNGVSRDFPLPLNINIRKQAYFTGISLPSTSLALRVTYTNNQILGRASMPIILQGAFDPQFGRVRLSARSSNNFFLRNGNSTIPYQAVAVVNQQRYALNDNAFANPAVTLSNLNEARQIPLQLEVSFRHPRDQASGGRHSDNLTLIAEVPFI